MGWTRSEIKEKAKKVLTEHYWQAFGVSLVLLITGGSHNGSGGSVGGIKVAPSPEIYFSHEIIGLISLGLFFAVLLRVFIGYMFEVGGRKFFIGLQEGDIKPGYLFYGFQNGRYASIFLTLLLRSIYIFFWLLLFIIPGIVKSYAYRLTPYILADNPEIGYGRGIELSKEMTKGEKWNIFILDLSFVGWYLLGVLALGFGIFFVQPYYDATNAELYLRLRERAIRNGLTGKEELNLD